MKLSDLKNSIREMIVNELSEGEAYEITSKSGNKITQTFPNSAEANKFKSSNSNIAGVKKLEEMAKISGDLATAIKSVINDNPDMDNLSLKKAIKTDPAVIAALDGEALHDNQLSRFISLATGERELGQRGRKVDLGNTLAKKMAELESQEKSLMNKLNKISQLKKELESSLGLNKIDEGQLDEMAKIAGDLASAIRNVVDSNSDLEGLPLKKAIKADSAVQSALAGDELYDNQLNKFIALLKGNRELGQRGRKADPEKVAKRSEEEKAKEAKRAEKAAKRAEMEKSKEKKELPKPTRNLMVKMGGDEGPSAKDIAKTEKELGIDIPKPVKKAKLSAEDEAKFNLALKGITAKVDRIKNKEAKPTDLELLKKAYNDEGIKKLFKKAGKDLDDLVAGIITTKKDKFDDVENDEL